MSSSLILRLSVVSRTGIGVAQQPSMDTETDAQLAAGLTAAILAFSKDVYTRDLQSLSFYDRSITFLPCGNTFVLIEISNQASDEVKADIITQIQSRVDPALSNFDNSQEFVQKADEILKELVSKGWIEERLDEIGINRPFKDARVYALDLINSGDAFTANGEFLLSCSDSIAEFMHKVDDVKKENEDIVTAFIPAKEDGEEKCHYLLGKFTDDKVTVAVFHVGPELSNTLFKLTPLLDRVVSAELSASDEVNVLQIMRAARNTHDITHQTDPLQNKDNISMKFIERSVKKKVDQVLYPMIVGEQLIVIGDKPSVTLFSNTLQLFAQHRANEVVEWLDEGDTVARNLTGMSPEKFRSIQPSINTQYVLVDLDKGKVENGKPNKYLSKFFDEVKKSDLESANSQISDRLNYLVTNAMQVTRLTTMSKEDGVERLQKMKDNIKNDDEFKLIMRIASQRNPLLEFMINDLSSAIKSAEDYFSDFI